MSEEKEIVSKEEARARGLKRYYTGKECKHGHKAERYVKGGCIECARLRRLKGSWSKYDSKGGSYEGDG